MAGWSLVSGPVWSASPGLQEELMAFPPHGRLHELDPAPEDGVVLESVLENISSNFVPRAAGVLNTAPLTF